MSNATWTVSGVLSDLIEDGKRAEMHLTVDDGVIEPHANEAKLRSPYLLSPSELRAG